MANAAKNVETAEELHNQIAELKAQGESDRIDFLLQLAGVRNVKAARAVLADHDNDVDKNQKFGICLSAATSESIAMWMLYGGMDGNGAMINFDKKTLRSAMSGDEYECGFFDEGKRFRPRAEIGS